MSTKVVVGHIKVVDDNGNVTGFSLNLNMILDRLISIDNQLKILNKHMEQVTSNDISVEDLDDID